MIPLPKLQAVTRVVVHQNCPDGISSALVLKDALPDVRVSFMSYGSREHRELAPEPGLLFCDFTPLRERAAEFVAAGALVLDHHPSAKDLVEAFGDNGVFGENDKNECGAWLAYRHVWLRLAEEFDLSDDVGRARVRHFAELAAVRDTWKTGDPRWGEACEQAALLLFFPFDDLCLSSFADPDHDYHLLGRVLMDKQLAAAQCSVGEGHSFFSNSRGTKTLMFQGVSTTSDAAEITEKRGTQQPDLVVGFHYRSDAGKLQLQFSMRSHTGYDVGAFAKHHGGGGHRAAAGFTVEVSPELSGNPYELFRTYLEMWEAGRD